MCILLISTAHPAYALILLSNRDEYLYRPTAPAAWWPAPHAHVLAGRDLQRDVHGTWLGITTQGRIAALTNFREDDPRADTTGTGGGPNIVGERSRGEIPKAFLTTPLDSHESSAEFAARFVERERAGGFVGVGGFSLVFGRIGAGLKLGDGDEKGEPLGIISNRTESADGVVWVREETWGLSNSHFGDRGWPKVVRGEEMLRDAVREDAGGKGKSGRDGGIEAFIDRLFDVLGVDTLPVRQPGEGWEAYLTQLRNSVFIPAVGRDETRSADEAGIYGTQKQTVVLVDKQGKVVYTEKTLFDDKARAVNGADNVRRFEFEIEGWGE